MVISGQEPGGSVAKRAESREADLVFLMGGQGSQYFGMARSLVEDVPLFRDLLTDLDSFYRSACGRSVLEYVYDPRKGLGDPCDDLELSGAGLMMVQYCLAELLRRSYGLVPDVLVGSSLGEFVALAVGGCITVQEGLVFLSELSRAVVRHCPEGGMLAVLGSPQLRYQVPELAVPELETVSVNHAEHFVTSGPSAALRVAAEALTRRGTASLLLPVRYAFHSSAMDVLSGQLPRACTSSAALPSGPVLYSALTTAPRTAPEVPGPWQVLRGPIRFTETLTALPCQGARFIDLTPAATLSTIARRSHPHLTTFPIITPFGNEHRNLDALRREFATTSKEAAR